MPPTGKSIMGNKKASLISQVDVGEATRPKNLLGKKPNILTWITVNQVSFVFENTY